MRFSKSCILYSTSDQTLGAPLLTCPPLLLASIAQGTHKRVINELLRPRTWKAPEERQFFLNAQDICELCDNAERIFREEKTVLELHGGCGWVGCLGFNALWLWCLGRTCNSRSFQDKTAMELHGVGWVAPFQH